MTGSVSRRAVAWWDAACHSLWRPCGLLCPVRRLAKRGTVGCRAGFGFARGNVGYQSGGLGQGLSRPVFDLRFTAIAGLG